MRFDGKVAVVTGASSGIGEAAAQAFAQAGASVCLVNRDRVRGAHSLRRLLDAGADAISVQADVSQEDQVRRMIDQVVQRWDRLDVLVNNAGVYLQGDITQTGLDDWEAVLATNLTGAFLCTKHVVPVMARGGKGVIVNVASEAGLVGIRGQVAYNVSKGGMIALTRSCAIDLADAGIRVNCLCPGTTDTPLVADAVNRAPDPTALRRHLEEIRPLKRLGSPDEIAQGVLFLASEEAGYATGAVLSMDGGYTTQ